MPRSVALADMITDVRSRADMTNDTHVSDAMITKWLNDGLQDLWRQLVKQDPEYLYASVEVDTTAGTFSYLLNDGVTPLADDFFQPRGVDVVVNGRQIPIRPLNFHDRIGPEVGPWYSYYNVPQTRYQIRGTGAELAIYFDPDPGTNTYLLHYVRNFEDLSGADTVDGIAGYERWPIVYAVVTAFLRENDTERALLAKAELEDLKAQIKSLASLRDTGEPTVMANVYAQRLR